MDIYQEIKAERIRQDAIWGGPEHDDEHETEDFGRFIFDRLSRRPRRQNLIQIAALAVAAVESLDRKAAKLLCPETHANGVCVLPAGHRCDHRFESSAAPTAEGGR